MAASTPGDTAKRPRLTDSSEDAEAEIVQLNVGGTVFATARCTLTKSRTLQALVAQRSDALRTAAGHYFVDRDPAVFREVLNFLRSGHIVFPQDLDCREQLLVEAQYYKIDDLIDLLSGRGLFRYELGPANVAIRDREDLLRNLYAQDPNNPIISSPTCDLIDVFNNLDEFKPSNDLSWQQIRGVSVFGRLSMEGRARDAHSVKDTADRCELPSSLGLATISAFEEAFATFSQGLLKGFDWSNVVVAGGSVLACLLYRPRDKSEESDDDEDEDVTLFCCDRGFTDSDLDLFLYALSEAQALVSSKVENGLFAAVCASVHA